MKLTLNQKFEYTLLFMLGGVTLSYLLFAIRQKNISKSQATCKVGRVEKDEK